MRPANPQALSDLPPLPGGLDAMWRIFVFGMREEPRLLALSAGVQLVASLPDALIALLLKFFGDGVQRRDHGEVLTAGVLLAVAAAGIWLLSVANTRIQRRFADRIAIALESHVAQLQAQAITIAHQERPELLDRLSMLRNQVFALDHLYRSALSTLSWLVRLSVTAAALASVSPWLLLIVFAALPTVFTSGWRPGIERQIEESVASHQRLQRHLFGVLTAAEPAKEIRVLGVATDLESRRRAERAAWYGPIARTRATSAAWYAACWAIFGFGYVAAIAYVIDGAHSSAGNLLLVLAAGSRLSAYISETVNEIGFLRGFWLDGGKRFVWLERYVASLIRPDSESPPDRLTSGIRLEGVSFTYPGAKLPALEDISLTLPAGAVVAVVGENGAGKSTLVKLLCKLYEPTSGTITVDGVPLAGIEAGQWRERLSGAFQDFAKLEFLAITSVGLGDLPRLDERPMVERAVTSAGADDVVQRLPDGLDTQLGSAWPGGHDLSIGQWQKLALARGFAREHPLLIVLDEPTSALDAETEHALFERYAARAAGGSSDDHSGGITLLVSHRFSTVRMADLIVVMDGSRVVEVGSHTELMARGGTYSELYTIQAAAYA